MAVNRVRPIHPSRVQGAGSMSRDCGNAGLDEESATIRAASKHRALGSGLFARGHGGWSIVAPFIELKVVRMSGSVVVAPSDFCDRRRSPNTCPS